MIRKLRHWKHADAGWFRDMDNICFPPPDTSFLNGPKYHWWIVGTSIDFAGYAGLYTYTLKDGTKEAYFCRAGVLPEYRKLGFHTDLIRARLNWAKRAGIQIVRTFTAADNVASIKNLKAAGFRGRKAEGGSIIRFSKEIH